MEWLNHDPGDRVKKIWKPILAFKGLLTAKIGVNRPQDRAGDNSISVQSINNSLLTSERQVVAQQARQYAEGGLLGAAAGNNLSVAAQNVYK